VGREDIQTRNIRWDSCPDKLDLKTDEIFIHRLSKLPDVRKSYEEHQWETTAILQSSAHDSPATMKPIGFPYNFPENRIPLSRWGDQTVLRLHVDVCRHYGRIVSWPHIEPDPKYEPEKHSQSYRLRNELRGPMVLNIFGLFYHDGSKAAYHTV